MKEITSGRPHIFNAIGMQVRCSHCGYVGEIEQSDIGHTIVASKGGTTFTFQCLTDNCFAVTSFKTPSEPCRPSTNT